MEAREENPPTQLRVSEMDLFHPNKPVLYNLNIYF